MPRQEFRFVIIEQKKVIKVVRINRNVKKKRMDLSTKVDEKG